MIDSMVIRAVPHGPVFFTLLLAILFSIPCYAGNFSVNPVRVELSQDKRIKALTVTNNGQEATSIQLDLAAWSQRAGEDIYAPTTELLATPPIFTLPAGKSQIIRVGLRRPAESGKELSYRLFLQEIPPPGPQEFQGLRVALRLSIPVFVTPGDREASPDLSWRLNEKGNETLVVEAVNRGAGHARVSQIRLRAGENTVQRSGNDYLLPGASRQWTFDRSAELTRSPIKLTATVNGKAVTATPSQK